MRVVLALALFLSVLLLLQHLAPDLLQNNLIVGAIAVVSMYAVTMFETFS